MLTALNAVKTFGNTPVLKDVSLTIQKGEIVGLAGPSGSGKSTLLRCFEGLETVDSGTIQRHGESGFMFQDFQLFPHLTVLENLTYAPRYVLKEPNAHEKALALLTQLGVSHKARQYPGALSGGQKQRVALARSLMMTPQILLCDEPTSGLDVATIEDVVDLLQDVHTRGITLVIASHDLDFLTHLATRIVVLAHGQIVADMDPRGHKDPIHELKKFYV